MANKVIKTKATKKVFNKFDNQEFLFIGMIERFSTYGLQLRKGRSQARFWFEITEFEDKNNILLSKSYNKGDEVKIVITFNSYINKEGEYCVKMNVKDLEKIEAKEAQYYEFNQPKSMITANVKSIVPTETPGLYILEAARLDIDEKEQETYHLRWYNKEHQQPELGTYEIKFGVYNSSKIIQNNGEIFVKEEEYTDVHDGQPIMKRVKRYTPCLEVEQLRKVKTE